MSDRCIHQTITNRQVQQGYPEEPSLFFLACIIFITYVFSFSSLQGGFYLIIHFNLDVSILDKECTLKQTNKHSQNQKAKSRGKGYGHTACLSLRIGFSD